MINILATLLVSQPLPACPYIIHGPGDYEITQGVYEECSVDDIWPEIMLDHQIQTGQNVLGPKIRFAFGHGYTADQVMRLGMQSEVRGLCESCTTIRTSTTGFKTMYRTEAEALMLDETHNWGRNGDSTIRDLKLESTLPPGSTDIAVGIELKKKAKIIDVTIQGFTIGVRGDCGVARPGLAASNCNTNRFVRLAVWNSRGPGIYLDGPDSGATYSQSNLLLNNCLEAQWDGQFTGDTGIACAGYVGCNFLNSTNVAFHGEVQARLMPHMLAGCNANAADEIVGGYFENVGSGSQALPRAYYGPRTRISGNGFEHMIPLVNSRGQAMSGELSSGLTVFNTKGVRRLELRLGGASDVADTAWVMRTDENTDWMYFKRVEHEWCWQLRNSPSLMPFCLGGTLTDPSRRVEGGDFWLVRTPALP